MKYSNVTDPSRTRDLVSGASILPSLSGRIQSNSTFNFNSRVIQSLYESDLILVGHNVDEKSALNPEKAEDRGNFDRRLITVSLSSLTASYLRSHLEFSGSYRSTTSESRSSKTETFISRFQLQNYQSGRIGGSWYQ